MKNPLQWAVYKGTGGRFGALQFKLQGPHYYNNQGQKDYTGRLAFDEDGRFKDGWKIREGAVFMEITSANGKNSYDWSSKIIFALSVGDMGKVLLGLSRAGKTEIMHDPHAKTDNANNIKKFLNVEVSDKGAVVSCSQIGNGERKSHSVPLGPDEVVTLRALLTRAISKSLNW